MKYNARSDTRKKYCIHCNQEIIYNVIEKEDTAVMRGKRGKYIYKAAICSNCGSELYVPQIHDEDLDRLEAVYKK